MSATVPTQEEFDALAQRVSDLESATPPPEPGPEPAPEHDFAIWFAGPHKNAEIHGDRIRVDGTDRWLLLNSNYGSGNNQREWNHPESWTLTEAGLNCHAQWKEGLPQGYKIRSGFASSRDVNVFYPLYSRFTIRAKVPNKVEDWPAFWLRHRNGSGFCEVDITEMFVAQTDKTTMSATIHEGGIGGGSNMHQPKFLIPDDGAFHEIVCEIAPYGNGGITIDFKVDGAGAKGFGKKYRGLEVFTLDDASGLINAGTEDAWDLAMNLAEGGNWIADPLVPYQGKLQNGQPGKPLDENHQTWRDSTPPQESNLVIESVLVDRIG